MKKIFSAFILSLVITTSAYAEHEKFNYNSQKPVSCTTPDRVRYILGDQLGEMPYMQGDGVSAATDGKSFIKTNLIIAINLETKTFSVVEIINDGLACIIGGGKNFRFNKPPQQKINTSLE